uniref:Uncharacterized protein n=1 Tax=Magnetococcus massalia (strain MO-1) TaxID=451514 RepID=A0A1S7LL92_MAGMO|nr:Protein of unknown function [Candidatus Magnetococcus massalia]
MDDGAFDLEQAGADVEPCPNCGWRNTPIGFDHTEPYYRCKGCGKGYDRSTAAEEQQAADAVKDPSTVS